MKFSEEDHSGSEITLSPACDGKCVSFNHGDYHLSAGKLPEFVAALCTAAGKPEPIILDRPEVDAEGDRKSGPFGVRLWQRSGVQITLWHGGVTLPPAEARRLAAIIAAYADVAADEPYPAEVEELAAEIRRGCDLSGDPSGSDRAAARAALRWMREREAQP